MKLNTSYYSQEDRKSVIKKIDFLFFNLKKKLRENFQAIQISHPLFLRHDSNVIIDSNHSRKITFDSASRKTINSLTFEFSLWLTEALEKYGIKKNEALMIHPQVILRDLKEDAAQTLVRDDLIIEICISRKIIRESNKDWLLEYTQKTYRVLESVLNSLHAKFKDPIQTIPHKINFVSSQLLENEYPNLSFNEREKTMFNEGNAFIIENPGQKLFSGRYHYDEDPLLFNVKSQSAIIAQSNVNLDPLKIAKISVRASGEVLENQISAFSIDYNLSNPLIQQIIKNQKPLSVQIKINLLTLAMFALNKAHISEILPLTWDNQNEENFNSKRLSTL